MPNCLICWNIQTQIGYSVISDAANKLINEIKKKFEREEKIQLQEDYYSQMSLLSKFLC